jgi:hypothetical protein
MKRWSSGKILLGVGVSLILVGITPIGFLLWRGSTQNWEPVSSQISLKRGEYKSPLFTTDLDDDYQIEIYSLPPHQIPLELDWRSVDESGTNIQSGAYSEAHQMGGNDAILTRSYRPKRGSLQRIIVNVHQDVQVDDADTRLHVGLPEKGLEAYGSALAIRWAVIVGGPGVIVILVLSLLGAIRPRLPGRASRSAKDNAS